MGGMENLAIGIPYLSAADRKLAGGDGLACSPSPHQVTHVCIFSLFSPSLTMYPSPFFPTQLAWGDRGRDLGWVSFRREALSDV